MKLRSKREYELKGPRPSIPPYVLKRYGRITRWPRKVTRTRPRGMNNPGNYCYRHSLVQCLVHLPALYNYLGTIHHECDKQIDECTTCALKHLMKKYWVDGTRADFDPNRPDNIVDALDAAVNEQCPEDFKEFATPGVQGDPHEYLGVLMEQLAETDSSNRLDQLVMLRKTIHRTCKDCNGTRNTDRNLGLQMGLAMPPNVANPRLIDYIHNDHVETLQFTCNCQTTKVPQVVSRTARISQAPDVLCVQLKRFSQTGAAKITRDIPFPEELDLTGETEGGANLTYRFYGVVSHRGANLKRGHYIATVRRRNGTDFVEINDRIVATNGMSFDEIRPDLRKAKFDPYLLFYLKI